MLIEWKNILTFSQQILWEASKLHANWKEDLHKTYAPDQYKFIYYWTYTL